MNTQAPQPQVQVNVQQPQMANGGTPDSMNQTDMGGGGFEPQETIQADDVTQSTDAPNPDDASTMAEGGEVSSSSDDLDWGMVFTFFKISNE
jgi:hypothetical protein